MVCRLYYFVSTKQKKYAFNVITARSNITFSMRCSFFFTKWDFYIHGKNIILCVCAHVVWLLQYLDVYRHRCITTNATYHIVNESLVLGVLFLFILWYVTFKHSCTTANEKIAMNATSKNLRTSKVAQFSFVILFVILYGIRTYFDSSSDYNHDFTRRHILNLQSHSSEPVLFFHHIYQTYWTIKFCHEFGVERVVEKKSKHNAWNPYSRHKAQQQTTEFMFMTKKCVLFKF